MFWRDAAAALLSTVILFQSTDAKLITITETASVCSAVYTSGSRSVTVVQSTITVVPIPWTDGDANGGKPFVLQVEPDGLATGRKRAAVKPVWVKPSGDTTTDGSQAAHYKITKKGALKVLSGGFISTGKRVKSMPFAASTERDALDTTFSVHQGMLNWTNPAFDKEIAQLYRTAFNGTTSGPVIARFHGPIAYYWSPVVVYARPVNDATDGASSTTVATSILSGSKSNAGGYPSPTASSNVSPNGLCSGSTGYTCAGSSFGSCCSELGFCGTGPEYCGAGCQPAYGRCRKSASSSAPITTSTSPTSTPSPIPIYTCPADNGTNVVDVGGVEYMIGCAQDIDIGASATAPVADSFNDCFALCDAAETCTAFTYIGGKNGIGSGVCYFKDLNATFVPGRPRHVSAIRLSPPGNTSSSSSSSTSLPPYTSVAGPIGPNHPGTPRTSTGYSNMTATATGAMPTSTLPVSPMGHCGTQGNGGTPDGFGCNGSQFGDCCSNSGFCGSTPEYCLIGCQTTYGECTAQTGQPITVNGECGPDFGNTTCTGGQFGPCCSTSGFCGSTFDYCSPSNCDPAFGTCTGGGYNTSMSSTMGSAIASTTGMSMSDSSAVMTSMPMSGSTVATSTTSSSMSSTIPLCPRRTCGPAATNSGACADAYGNTFNITCGTSYTGTTIVRAAKPNVGACLTQCDATPNCVAVNYVGGQCELLSDISGTTQVPGAAAAQRPPHVTTVYSTPPSTTTTMSSDTAMTMSATTTGDTMLMSTDSMTTSETLVGSKSTLSLSATSGSSVATSSSLSSAVSSPSSTGTSSVSTSSATSSLPTGGSSSISSTVSAATRGSSGTMASGYTSSSTSSISSGSSGTSSVSSISSSASTSSQTTSSSSAGGNSPLISICIGAQCQQSASVSTTSTSSSSGSTSTRSTTTTSTGASAISSTSSASSSSRAILSTSSSSSTRTRTGSYTGPRTRSQTTTTTTSSSSTATATFTATPYNPPCPAANGTGFTDTAGNQYLIMCDTNTNPGAIGVNNFLPNFAACINSCATQTTSPQQCIAVTYVGGACYYKSEYLGSASSIGTNAAVLVSAVGQIPATYTPQPTTTTTTTITRGPSGTRASTYSAPSSSSSTRSATNAASSSTSSAPSSVAPSSSASSGTQTTAASSSTSAYLVLTSPTACNFAGDPPNTDEDDSYCEIDLPFPMSMYAQSSTATYASTNGFLSILSGSAQYQPAPFPMTYLPNNTVAPFMDDLYLYGTSTPQDGIWYQFNAGRTAVTYEYFLERAGDVSYPFHFTVGYDSVSLGVFVFTYYSTGGPNDNGVYCSIGTQGLDATGTQQGFTYSYESADISPGLVVTCDTNQNTCVTTTPGGYSG